jgi:uncharacterized membrane protein
MGQIQELVDRIESSERLDRLADRVEGVTRPLLTSPGVNAALTGRWLGHRAHPMAVALPIGCWTSAALLDLTGSADAARRLTGAGVLVAVPTALTGAADWLETSGPDRRTGVAHAALNDLAVGAFALSWLARRRQRRLLGAALSGVGLVGLGAAGYLGGHLAHARGVGVDVDPETLAVVDRPSPPPGPAESSEPAPTVPPAPEAADGTDLEALTKAELYEMAKRLELPGRSGMTKAQLLEALRDRRPGA